MDKLLLKYWAVGNSTNLEVVAAELTAKINQLIDELTQLKSESQKRDEQVREAIRFLAKNFAHEGLIQSFPITPKQIDEILNSTKE